VTAVDDLDEVMASAERHASGPVSSGPPPVGRLAPCLMAIGTALLFTGLLGFTAVVAGAGPELFGDHAGGTVDLGVTPKCGWHTETLNRPCFNRVNATVVYQDGSEEEFPVRSQMMWFEGHHTLKESRATILVETEQGVWSREVWVFEGSTQRIQVSPDSPRTTSDVIGRDSGAAFLYGAGAAIALLSLMGALVWGITGSLGAAVFVRFMVGIGVLILGLFTLGYLFRGILGIGWLLFVGWFVLMFWLTHRWIGTAEQGTRSMRDQDEGPSDVPGAGILKEGRADEWSKYPPYP
jgi:hypothetical protein